MEDFVDGSWGQLVSVTDVDSPPFPLIEDKFTIGRARDCDISLGTNKLVSGRHCHIEKDAEGRVWLCDTSTNGTLLNTSVKITKGNKKELSHGDEFFVVYKKDEEDINIGYMYQNLEELQKEMDATQDYSSGIEMEATLIDDSVNIVEEDSGESSKKRSAEDEPNTSESEPPTKRVKTDEPKDGQEKTTLDEKGHTTGDKDKDAQKEATSEDIKKDSANKPATSAPCVDGTDEIEEALICTICQELMHDCISLQPCMHSYCAGCYSDWMATSNICPTCRMKVERINKNHIVNNLIEAYLKENPEKKRDEEDLKELDAKNKISRDMLYPETRQKRQVAILEFSDPERSASDSDSSTSPPESPVYQYNTGPPPLLGFGTPVFGTVRPTKTVCRQCQDYQETVNKLSKDPNATNTCANATNACADAAATTSGTPDTPTQNAGPENKPEGSEDSQATLPTGDEAQPGPSGEQPGPSGEQPDPDVKTMPTAPAYVCLLNQTHVLCQCCLQPMPDRRTEYAANPGCIPPQQCNLCYRAFCHAYWGCRKIDCMGCIGKFKDINFGKKCLPNLILDNQHESNVFKNYLEKKNLSVKYVLQQCLAKVATGEFTFKDLSAIPINGETPLCYPCGLRKFKDLAYLFRFSIPKANLPAEVTARPDCHWGKNCRTQRHNINHAQRFNHICDQTRMM